MYRALNQTDLQQSKNQYMRDYAALYSSADSSNLAKLFNDSHRCGNRGSSGRGGLYVYYNHHNLYSLRPGEQGSSDTTRFEHFLKEQIKDPVKRNYLVKQWQQDITQSIRNIINEVIKKQREALLIQEKSLVTAGWIYECDQAETFEADAGIKLNIYEDDNDLLIDAVYSDIAIYKVVERANAGGTLGSYWIPYQKISGEVFVRWKVESSRVFMDECVVNNRLLYRLLTEADVTVTPEDVRRAKQEVEEVEHLEIALTNGLYNLERFCDSIRLEGERNYSIAAKLHNELLEQKETLFENVRLHCEEGCRQSVATIKAKLRAADRVFYRYRNWLGIAGNIAAAATGVGLLGMLAKGVYTAIKGSFSPLLFQTRKAKELKAIENQVGRIRINGKAPAAA